MIWDFILAFSIIIGLVGNYLYDNKSREQALEILLFNAIQSTFQEWKGVVNSFEGLGFGEAAELLKKSKNKELVSKLNQLERELQEAE